MVLLLAVQAMGLQLLCFCGHCPTSFALGVVAIDSENNEATHSCCAAALDEQAEAQGLGQASNGGPCCRDQHQLRAADVTAQSQPDPAVAHPPQAEPLPPPFDTAHLAAVGDWRATSAWARGPPLARPPNLSISLHRLLI